MTPANRKIVILGGGPLGVEAALYARKLGYPTEVLEQGSEPCANVRRWQQVSLFSPFSMNSSPLGRATLSACDPGHQSIQDDAVINGKQWIEQYFLPLTRTKMLEGVFHFNQKVLSVGKSTLRKTEEIGRPCRGEEPFRILCEQGNGENLRFADILIDATGTFGNAKWMGAGSMPAIGESVLRQGLSDARDPAESLLANRISFELPDLRSISRKLAGKKILLLGSGYSAATNVVTLASFAAEFAIEIDWITRDPETGDRDSECDQVPIQRIENDPLGSRDRLANQANEAVSSGIVNWFPGRCLERIGSGSVRHFEIETFSTTNPDEHQRSEYDFVIANVGFAADENLLAALQVHTCYATGGPMKLAATLLSQSGADCTQIITPGPETIQTTEPNLFVIGSKSYGRNSSFLFANGLKQVQQVFSLIANQPELDLYQPTMSFN